MGVSSTRSRPVWTKEKEDGIAIKKHVHNSCKIPCEGNAYKKCISSPIRASLVLINIEYQLFQTFLTKKIRVTTHYDVVQESASEPSQPPRPPGRAFRLKSLVKLKLNLHSHCSLVVPSVIHLNNLKSLHLKWVQFDDD
ncbi:hypothetical protein QJS10_CPA09g00880 [Acorus calamus]|uniref:Uncharacterized protein n=1 Tax=Acorus calamus TaxID=4465 RepID=A0AAV9E8G4_ACOCL|nr:hypothetical protein QJS10_CPA09g00880 [Acorus calamus]